MSNENKHHNINLWSLSDDYDLEHGHESTPLILETYDARGWINYGYDNLFPQFLDDLSMQATRHAAILKRKADIVYGRGINFNGLGLEGAAFIKNAMNKNETWDDIYRKIVKDYVKTGGFALYVIWNKEHTKINEFIYMPISRIRVASDQNGVINGYYVHPDWRQVQSGYNLLFKSFIDPIKYAPYSIYSKERHQIYYYKGDSLLNFYPQPDYAAALEWITIDTRIPSYHLNGIDNGFNPGMLINFPNGVPDEKTQEKIVGRFQDKYQKVKNNQRPLITFSDSKDTAPTIEAFNQNQDDKRYMELAVATRDAIYEGHGINDTALFGVKEPGQLGTQKDMALSLAIFQSMYVDGIQILFEKIINDFAKINGVNEWITIDKYYLNIPKEIEKDTVLSILPTELNNKQREILLQLIGGLTEEDAKNLVYAKDDSIEENKPIVDEKNNDIENE